MGGTQNELAEFASELGDSVPYIKYLRHPQLDIPNNEPLESRTPVYDTVQRDKWVRYKAADNAAARVRERLESKIDTTQVEVTVSHDDSHGPEGRAVTVRSIKTRDDPPASGPPTVDIHKLEQLVPSEVTGTVTFNGNTVRISEIPVRLEEVTQTQLGPCKKYYFNNAYSPIRSGCKGHLHDAWEDVHGAGTIATPAYDDVENRWVMLSAGHIINDPKWIQQPNEGTGFDLACDWSAGARWKNTATRDFGYAIPNKVNLTSNLASDSGGSREDYFIAGIMTFEHATYGTDVEKQGARTGITSGYITEHNSNHQTLYSSCNAYHNDSGSPVYAVEEENYATECYLSYIAAWGQVGGPDCPYYEVYGNSAELIESTLGIDV